MSVTRQRRSLDTPAISPGTLGASGLERLTFRQVILLFIPAYAMHILEEFPRFIEWTHRYPGVYGAAMDATKFAVGDSLFVTYVLVAVGLLLRAREAVGVVAGLSIPAWALSNGLLHLSLNIASGLYSPGAISAAMLYVPLSVLAYDRARKEGIVTPRRLALSIAAGAGVQHGVLALGRVVG